MSEPKIHKPVHISRSEDSLIDILDSPAIDLKGLSIHCTFSSINADFWVARLLDQSFKKGLVKLSFSDGNEIAKS